MLLIFFRLSRLTFLSRKGSYCFLSFLIREEDNASSSSTSSLIPSCFATFFTSFESEALSNFLLEKFFNHFWTTTLASPLGFFLPAATKASCKSSSPNILYNAEEASSPFLPNAKGFFIKSFAFFISLEFDGKAQVPSTRSTSSFIPAFFLP